jgi:hypothetical protein
VVLAVDAVSATSFIEGVGTISLNPASSSLLVLFDGTQAIPGSGFLDLTFPVPGLSGFTAYFQGALFPAGGSPPLLITNLLPYTIQ